MDISGFEMIQELGRGGMGVVWKARQLSLDRVVAIKILSPAFVPGADDIQRFKSEAMAAAKLKHSGIVQVYDAQVQDDCYYYVMEFVEGCSVANWLARKGRVPERDALLIAESVVDALEYAWNRERIIHCDIKPENVLVDADGTVKVTDLGLARSMRLAAEVDDNDEITGTPPYMAPEQAMGRTELDFRVDVYALGATLYHLVTGRMPFAGHSDEAIVDLQITGTLPDPLEVNPKLSTGVCWLIEKMMWKDPRGRYESWAAVKADILRVKEGRLPDVQKLRRHGSTVLRSWRRQLRFITRSHSGFAGCAVVMAALAAAGVVGYQHRDGVTAWIHRFRVQEPIREQPVPPPESYAVPDVQPVIVTQVIRVAESPIPDQNLEAKWQLQEALKWAAANPFRYDDASAKFGKIAQSAPGSEYAALAREAAGRIAGEKAAWQDVLSRLKQQAAGLVASNQFSDAAQLYRNYAGDLQDATREARNLMAENLDERQKQHEDALLKAEQDTSRTVGALMPAVASALLKFDFETARQKVQEAADAASVDDVRQDLQRLVAAIDDATTVEQKIRSSLQADIGKTIQLQLLSVTDRITAKLIGMDGDVLTVIEDRRVGSAIAKRRRMIRLTELGMTERLGRISDGGEADTHQLAKGLCAWQCRRYSVAIRYFKESSPLVGPLLVESVEKAAANP
jgi:serine/threonine protein kinase